MMMGNSAETMTLTFHCAGMPGEHCVFLGLTRGGREIQKSPRLVSNILYLSERRVNHVTLMQLSEWRKAAVRTRCPHVCNNTVKSKVCVCWRGDTGLEGTCMCAWVCVPLAFWASHYPLTVLSLHCPSPLTCPVASRLQTDSSCFLILPLFQPPFLLFLPSLSSQSLPIAKIMTTSFTLENLAEMIYSALRGGWWHLINANIIQISMSKIRASYTLVHGIHGLVLQANCHQNQRDGGDLTVLRACWTL